MRNYDTPSPSKLNQLLPEKGGLHGGKADRPPVHLELFQILYGGFIFKGARRGGEISPVLLVYGSAG